MKRLGLAVSLVAVLALGCKKESTSGGGSTPGGSAAKSGGAGQFNVGWFPADTDLLAELTIGSIRKSPMWDQLWPQIEKQAGEDFAKVKEACGFNPIEKFNSLWVGAGKKSKSAIFAVQFEDVNRKQIEECATKLAQKDGKTVTQAEKDGVAHYTVDGEEIAVVWVSDTFIVGTKAGEGIDDAKLKECAAGKCGLTADAKVASLLARAEAGAPVRAAFAGELAAQLSEAVAGTQGGFVAVKPTDGFSAKVSLVFDKPENANAAAEMIKTQVQGIKPMLGQLGTVIDKLKVAAAANDMNIELAMTKEELKQLEDMAKGMMGG